MANTNFAVGSLSADFFASFCGVSHKRFRSSFYAFILRTGWGILTASPQFDILENMDIKIEFARAAFDHDLTREDILHAFETCEYDAVNYDKDLDGSFLLIGFDCSARLIEVLYDVLEDDETMKVFHAMRCRPALIKKYL
jgi:hypothetical protein